jgi:ABC-type oligopeptide transport system ATPase subunit
MQKGEIVEMGNTEIVLKQPRHQYTKMLISAVPGFQSNF